MSVHASLETVRGTEEELLWLQSSPFRRNCELRSGNHLFASLVWKSSLGAVVEGATADGRWRMRLEGLLFKQWVTIYSIDLGTDIAVFQALPSLNGVLEFKTGRRYSWDSNFWLTKWIWTDEEGREIMRVQRNLSLKAEGTVQLHPGTSRVPDLPLLTILGWYLILLLTDVRPG